MSEDKITLVCPFRDAASFIDFAKRINEWSAKGYEISTKDSFDEYPQFYNRPQVTMVPRKVVDVSTEVVPTTEEIKDLTVLEQLEVITKKDDLLSFAKEHNIEVPEDVKTPLGIKKLLKEKLTAVEDNSSPSE
jgi:hypothetical protein